jgi:hypothetical protein
MRTILRNEQADTYVINDDCEQRSCVASASETISRLTYIDFALSVINDMTCNIHILGIFNEDSSYFLDITIREIQ